MEKVLLIIIVFMLCSVLSKLDDIEKLHTKKEKTKKRNIEAERISKLIDLKVSITIDEDNIDDMYLFDPVSGVTGVIKNVSPSWIEFEYETKKETITRYFRLTDIISVDEVK